MSNQTLNNDPNNCAAKGVLLPLISEADWRLEVRATLYLLGLLWLFLAVALVADTFMCGIERITSKTRIVRVQDPENKDKFTELEVKVWNSTVANLTLMAFGTSAPEILLSVIETVSKGFKAGELGPGTIVGSAAFNLLVITSVCIVAIPKGEIRRIKNIQVYAVTTFWGVFAYLWLLIVLIAITPNQVDVWEGVVTFLMFPSLVISAYIADKRCGCRSNRLSTSAELEIGIEASTDDVTHHTHGKAEILSLARELGRLAENSHLTEDEVARLAALRLSSKDPHSHAWHRVNALRHITAQASRRDTPTTYERMRRLTDLEANTEGQDLSEDNTKAVVEFLTRTCAVLENEGRVRLGVRRYGNLDLAFHVNVETIDGTAEAGSDYVQLHQKLYFAPKDTVKDVFVEIIDDDIWEPDEIFYVKLSLDVPSTGDKVILGQTPINTVTIVNDDEPGRFEFLKPSFIVKESADFAYLEVKRINGADGTVEVRWRTIDGTAVNNQEYKGGEGKLVFRHGETSHMISIPIIAIPSFDTHKELGLLPVDSFNKPNKEPHFSVELFAPTGGALIGKLGKTIVTIINDDAFEGMVSRIAEKAKKDLEGLRIDTSTWGEQFYNAFNVNEGDRENTTTIDYFMHFLTFFWKVVFAFIPPPSIAGGWLTFILSLIWIGFLTALINDLASIFGCLVGLEDTVTAITLVALGTSMPDTFASKSAAINERHADDSVGNVNGSNAVNVFLGLGLPWVIASVYWHVKGEVYDVPAGSVTFSVILFAGCAVVCVTFLMLRRAFKVFGQAELGGPSKPKYVSAFVISSMWVLYIIMSSLQAMGVIHANV